MASIESLTSIARGADATIGNAMIGNAETLRSQRGAADKPSAFSATLRFKLDPSANRSRPKIRSAIACLRT
jgi:hypothetical protein